MKILLTGNRLYRKATFTIIGERGHEKICCVRDKIDFIALDFQKVLR
jgi:hypothetical protein